MNLQQLEILFLDIQEEIKSDKKNTQSTNWKEKEK